MTHSDNFVSKCPGEKYIPECTQSVMIWSYIDGQDPGPIYFVEEIMRQDDTRHYSIS